MIPFQKILCPVDFSAPSIAALDAAAELARHFDSELWVVHVVMPVPSLTVPTGYPIAMDVPRYQQDLEETSRHTLEELIASHVPAGVHAHPVLIVGDAAPEIRKFAEEHALDLIVIATHGRTGWQHFMFGSVAERVIRTAPCAVLTIRAPKPGAEEERK